MSTRCNVIIRQQGVQVVLYHHHDGYPEGVGMDLIERFGKNFRDEKAHVLSLSYAVNALIKDQNDEYEWCLRLHGDIEYLYTVDLERKTIVCEAVDNWDEFKITDTIDMLEFAKEYEQKKQDEEMGY